MGEIVKETKVLQADATRWLGVLGHADMAGEPHTLADGTVLDPAEEFANECRHIPPMMRAVEAGIPGSAQHTKDITTATMAFNYYMFGTLPEV